MDITGVESLLLSIHVMGAAALKDPGFALNQVEANRLAAAIIEVQNQYPLVIDPKTRAWLNLAAIAGIVYAPRIIGAVAKRGKKKSADIVQLVPKDDGAAAPTPTKQTGPLTPADLFGMAGAGAE